MLSCFTQSLLTQEDINRFKRAFSKSPIHALPGLQWINERLVPRSKSKTPAPKKESKMYSVPESTTLDFESIMQAIEKDALPKGERYKVDDITEEEFSALIDELHPDNDNVLVSGEPSNAVVLGKEGTTLGRRRVRSVECSKKTRSVLRPIIVANNHFRLEIPWYDSIMDSARQYQHVAREHFQPFLNAIAANKNGDLLYRELQNNPDILLEPLRAASESTDLVELIDERLIPILFSQINAGSDEHLYTLCALAKHIDLDIIDPLLSSLLDRWVSRFNSEPEKHFTPVSNKVWWAMSSLKVHPRFHKIPNIGIRLSKLLQYKLDWHDKSNIIDLISQFPEAYYLIEEDLIKAIPSYLPAVDVVEKLDLISHDLFGRLP